MIRVKKSFMATDMNGNEVFVAKGATILDMDGESDPDGRVCVKVHQAGLPWEDEFVLISVEKLRESL
jgi:hypothetical protein